MPRREAPRSYGRPTDDARILRTGRFFVVLLVAGLAVRGAPAAARDTLPSFGPVLKAAEPAVVNIATVAKPKEGERLSTDEQLDAKIVGADEKSDVALLHDSATNVLTISDDRERIQCRG